MTDEEIEKEAKKYAHDKMSFCEDYDFDYKTAELYIKQGVLYGFAEGKPKWHDLKNPNDLPKESGRYLCFFGGNDGYFIMDYETEVKSFGYWCAKYDSHSLGFIDTEFETLAERDEDEVIAWCELPQFKE